VALIDVARATRLLHPSERSHLERLVGWWPMLADLCFSDLVVYLPTSREGAESYVIVDHIRPATSQTIYPTELVGEVRTAAQRPLIAGAHRSGASVEGEIDSAWLGEQIRVRAIPIRSEGQVIGVVARESATSTRRQPGELERTYLQLFDRLAGMIERGELPFVVDEDRLPDSPRVGDGVMVADETGTITYASPNATSAITRSGASGIVIGQRLDQVGLGPAGLEALVSRRPASMEIETAVEALPEGEVIISARCIPLVESGRVTGAVVLVRDVTDLRRRDRLLISKDATIREIHHRVKNNLQTISSLLRIQGRRLTEPSARAAIEESVRRVRSIAVVHEILSRDPSDDVAFGDVIRPLVRLVEEGLVAPDRPVRFEVSGEPGEVPSPVATSLAVVLTELLQNVVDHAYQGISAEDARVRVAFDNDGSRLHVVVSDNGVGLPAGFDVDVTDSLGLTIVRTLVTTELGGALHFGSSGGPPERPGTEVSLEIPIQGWSGAQLARR
jgi:two-component sensor histidine kinase